MANPLYNLNSPGHPVWRITNFARAITKLSMGDSKAMQKHNQKKLRKAMVTYRDQVAAEIKRLDDLIALMGDDL